MNLIRPLRISRITNIIIPRLFKLFHNVYTQMEPYLLFFLSTFLYIINISLFDVIWLHHIFYPHVDVYNYFSFVCFYINPSKTLLILMTNMIILLCCGINLFCGGQYSYVLRKNPAYSWRRILEGNFSQWEILN